MDENNFKNELVYLKEKESTLKIELFLLKSKETQNIADEVII